jgi:hypothetical protein
MIRSLLFASTASMGAGTMREAIRYGQGPGCAP